MLMNGETNSSDRDFLEANGIFYDVGIDAVSRISGQAIMNVMKSRENTQMMLDEAQRGEGPLTGWEKEKWDYDS